MIHCCAGRQLPHSLTCLADTRDSTLATRVRAGLLFGPLGAAGSGIAVAGRTLPGAPVVLTGAVVFGAGLLQVRRGEFAFRSPLAFVEAKSGARDFRGS